MDSIQINNGLKRIAVNGDENRVIEFNPEDIVFVEKFYGLIKEFEQKEVEFRQRADEINAVEGVDEYGIPVNTAESIQLVVDLCKYLRVQIDNVFGKDTSQKVFGDAMTLNMFEQFFTGITPFVQNARKEKVSQYRKTSKTMK